MKTNHMAPFSDDYYFNNCFFQYPIFLHYYIGITLLGRFTNLSSIHWALLISVITQFLNIESLFKRIHAGRVITPLSLEYFKKSFAFIFVS